MFPIYICWDSSLNVAERYAILRGVEEIKEIFGCPFICYGSQPWLYGRYASADEIMRSAPRNARKQADASAILTTMTQIMSTWVEPGAMILFTGADLCMNGVNWCFGAARSGAKMTVQSVVRYRGLSEEMMSACIRRTMRHELGHIFECAKDLRRSNTEMNLGEHCTNPHCSMRQTLDLPTLIRMAGEESERNCFCGQCMTDLQSFKRRYEKKEKSIVKPRGRHVAYETAAQGIPHRNRA